MTINSRLHYELEGVWVTHNLLGTSQEIAFRGYECAVLWPAHAEDFGLGGSSLRATKAGSSTATGDHLVEVKIVRVEVRGLSSDLTAAEFEDQRDLPENDVIVEMQRVALEASVVSDAFISDFVQRVRVTAGQFWLGSSTHRPPQVWMAHFVDADGLTIRMGGVQQPPDELIAGKPELSLEVSSVAAILAQLGRGDPIPIPESLIQEARYTLWASPHADPTMATFLAALAVESKAHETLRGIANDDQQHLVEYVLKNPREVTVSAARRSSARTATPERRRAAASRRLCKQGDPVSVLVSFVTIR